jgi:hypothetical protein
MGGAPRAGSWAALESFCEAQGRFLRLGGGQKPAMHEDEDAGAGKLL